MEVTAKVNFVGKICGQVGKIMDIPDNSPALADLLKAGYVEKTGDVTDKKTEEKPKKRTVKK